MRQKVRERKQMWRANVKMRYNKEFEPHKEKCARRETIPCLVINRAVYQFKIS